MRILQTLHWVQFAGTEKVCVDLCNEMSKEHEVFLLSNLKIKKYLNEKVNVINFDFQQNRYNPFFLYKTSQILKKINPDIIQCHNAKEIEIIHYAQFFLNKKIPIVATKHTLSPKKAYKFADLGVAILEDTKEIINSKNKIIIKNGMQYSIPKKTECKTDKFYIVSSGRLSHMKGMDIVIKALKNVNFDYECHIFGRGEQEKELIELINKLELNNKIFLKGFTDNINDYLFSCDLQIISSRFEPYGLVAIDGIYYSPLMISTNTGICSQILPKELIFNTDSNSLTEKLNEIYENYDKFVNIFSKIKDKKDDFGVEKMAKKYIEAYKSLL